jgi:chitodextrinase
MKSRRPVLAPSALLFLVVLVLPAPALAQSAWNSVRLTWTASGDDSLTGRAAQYDLRYSTSVITAANFAAAIAVSGLPVPAAAGAAESFTVTGLQPATTYWFAIRSADESGNWAGVSNVISRATTGAPDTLRPAAVAIAVTALTDSTATLGWSAPGDDSLTGTATSYEIRYSTAPITAANFASATAVTGPAPAAAGTAQSAVVRGLARQVTYYFALRAVDDAGNRAALSNVPSATTTDTMAPAAIRNLAAGFVWVSWRAGTRVHP